MDANEFIRYYTAYEKLGGLLPAEAISLPIKAKADACHAALLAAIRSVPDSDERGRLGLALSALARAVREHVWLADALAAVAYLPADSLPAAGIEALKRQYAIADTRLTDLRTTLARIPE